MALDAGQGTTAGVPGMDHPETIPAMSSPSSLDIEGSLSPNTRLALRRAIARRSDPSPLAYTRESSSNYSIPPPPSPQLDRYSRGNLTPPPPVSSEDSFRKGKTTINESPPPPPSPSITPQTLRQRGILVDSNLASPPSPYMWNGSRKLAPSWNISQQQNNQAAPNKASVIQGVVLRPASKQLHDRRANRRTDIAHARGWDTEHAPTKNCFLLRAMLDGEKDPWKNRALYLMTAHQMSSVVENFYCTPASFRQGTLFKYEPTDTVVCGVPRSGQMPVIHALHCLKSGAVINPQELVDRVPWPEALYNSPDFAMPVKESPRLIRTHMPLRYALGSDTSHSHFAKLSKTFKVVAVLRDPLDLRLSWFRHVRRMFGKYVTTKKFDQYFVSDDFAKVPRSAVNLRMGGMFDSDQDYENFVMEVLRALEDQVRTSPTIMVVFYEEILQDPLRFVKRLAEFTGHGVGNDVLIQEVADALRNSKEHPMANLRQGASGQGKQYMSSLSCDYINNRWLDLIKVQRSAFPSYEKLYEHFTGESYPFRTASAPPPRRSSFNLFRGDNQQPQSAINLGPSTGKAPKRSSIITLFRRRKAKSDASTDVPVGDPDDTSDDEVDVREMRIDSDD